MFIKQEKEEKKSEGENQWIGAFIRGFIGYFQTPRTVLRWKKNHPITDRCLSFESFESLGQKSARTDARGLSKGRSESGMEDEDVQLFQSSAVEARRGVGCVWKWVWTLRDNLHSVIW